MSMTSFVHDSKEWHDKRARHVGSSEVCALFDLPAEETPTYARSRYALWHVKAGNVPPPPVDNPRVRWGIRLEAVIAEAAAEENGWSVQKGGYFTDIHCKGLGASLDYVIDYDPNRIGPGVLELKNVDWLIHKRSWQDEPPLHILLQLQHQLAATGYTWGVVCCLVGGNDLRIYRYDARPTLIADIRRRVNEFWASIDSGDEPKVDGSDSASYVLRALFPEVVDDSVEIQSNEWAEACDAFNDAGERRRAANADYDDAKNRVVALLGGHKRGYGQGWSVNTSITPENTGRAPKPGELIGVRKEVRKYSVKEMNT